MKYLRILLRLILMRLHASKVPTGIRPLLDIKSVVIFVDHEDEHCEPAKVQMTHFFESYGIKVRIINADDSDIRTASDMFLAVNYKPSISERYAATSSTACYKVSRHQIKGGIYDLVVSEMGDEPLKVDACFLEIKHYLTMVR